MEPAGAWPCAAQRAAPHTACSTATAYASPSTGRQPHRSVTWKPFRTLPVVCLLPHDRTRQRTARLLLSTAQLVLDGLATFGGFTTGSAVAAADPFPGQIWVEAFGFFLGCYYGIQVALQASLFVNLLLSSYRSVSERGGAAATAGRGGARATAGVGAGSYPFLFVYTGTGPTRSRCTRR